MLESFNNIIGTIHGDYVITDITYDPVTRNKDFGITCMYCGNVLHRTIKPKRRWNSIIKRCQCTRDAKRKNLEKSKKIIIENRVGRRYGDYEITSLDDARYTMVCVRCGHQRVIAVSHFNNLKFECHECAKRKIKFDDSYIGRKNNMLTVLGYERVSSERNWFRCKCDCGKIVTVKPTFWENGTVKSCGCFAESKKLEHSEALDRLRRIYSGMIQRCYNPNSHAYKYYGERGISICDEWRYDREAFIAWALSHGYSNNLTIDRINNDGNYEPDNCRWADRKTQANNQRRDNIVPPINKPRKTWTIDGETKYCKEWCDEYGVKYGTVMYRISHKNMTIKEALETKKYTKCRHRSKL